MLKKLGMVQFHKAVKDLIEKNTGKPCYDEVPDNAPAPFYFMEIIQKVQNNSKTMWKETISTWIHVIASPSKRSVEIYELIESLEEALTEEIVLPPAFELLNQVSAGTQVIKTDPSGEKHAILQYDFTVCYGYKTKN